MKTSITLEQAEIFYKENKDKLIEIMFSAFQGNIDHQYEYNQIAVWFDGFCICYQDSDMNGNGKGRAHWDNSGADTVYNDLGKILKNDGIFSELYASDETDDSYFLNAFIDDFCSEFAKRNNIDEMLQSMIDE
tara:strand:+ start:91471 stop:91869 length:399 start_codon:yes stop_codon:yes gene_type:complete